MKFAICNETFQGWDWEATCRYVGECGYDGIEIAPFTLAEDVTNINGLDRLGILDKAVLADLDVIGLHWLLVSPKGLSVTSPDREVRARTSDYLVGLVQFCTDMDMRNLVLGSPAQRRIP